MFLVMGPNEIYGKKERDFSFGNGAETKKKKN